MRICLFTHTFPRFPGDTAAPFMGELTEALCELGHEVVVLVPYDSEIKTNVQRPYRLVSYRYIFPDSLHKLGYSRTLKGDKGMGPFAYFLSPFLYFFAFIALFNLVRREKIDIVSSHWIIPNGFLAALVKKFTGVPFTTTIPGSDVYLAGKNALFSWMAVFAARGADWVISDSQHYLEQLYELGFRPKRDTVIRYGVNTKKFKPTSKDRVIIKNLKLRQDTPTVVAVGRMVAKKGFVYLIEAMQAVLHKAPQAKLVLVGDGDERKGLEHRTQELGIQDSVIFAGTIAYDQLSKYYNLADVFVMPSIRDESGNIDASPVAMMEAMSCGTPVVATKFSGSDDLIVPGRTGYLVKEKDGKAIASSVVELLALRGSQRTRQEISGVAQQNFSTEAVARKYTEVFGRILL